MLTTVKDSGDLHHQGKSSFIHASLEPILKLNSYGVGDGNFNGQSIAGIADTGTTLLLLPDSVVSDYYGSISGAQNDQSAGGYVFPCSADVPAFVVGVESSQFTIPSSYMNLGPISDGSSSKSTSHISRGMIFPLKNSY